MCCLVEGNASSEVVSKACEEYELTVGGNYGSYKDNCIGGLSANTRQRQGKPKAIIAS